MRNIQMNKKKRTLRKRRRDTMPPGYVETLEEFLARGGRITYCAPQPTPGRESLYE
jgi:hypothetical protein